MRSSNFMYFWYFKRMLLFHGFAWFFAANICVYFQYLFMHYVCANIFGAIVLNLRFKIDVVVMIIWSIVIIINSVLTLHVSTASLPHDREPCEIKVVSNHTCSLHTCVCAGAHTPKWLSTAGNQFNSWWYPQVPYSGPGLCGTDVENQPIDWCIVQIWHSLNHLGKR